MYDGEIIFSIFVGVFSPGGFLKADLLRTDSALLETKMEFEDSSWGKGISQKRKRQRVRALQRV